MPTFLLLFLFFCGYGFSSLENDASIAIQNSINPISGDYIISEVDLVARGYEPIPIERTYLSSMQYGNDAAWILMPHLFIYFEPNQDPKKKPSEIFATEPHGTKIHYQNSLHCKTTYLPFFDKRSEGLTNSSKNEISAKTNLRNYKIQKLEQDDRYVLITPDGTERYYKKIQEMYFACLEKERKPNGNWLIYSYNEDFYTLKQIRSTNPHQTITYASITFSHKHKDPSIDRSFSATAHTGEAIEYHFEIKEKDKERFFELKQIKSSLKEEESLSYSFLDKRADKLVTQRTLGSNLLTKINYYSPGRNQVGQDLVTILDKFDPIEKRIKTLEEPVGPQGELLTTHRFFYNLGQHPKEKKKIDFSKLKQPLNYTVDYDIFNKKTVYCFNENFVPVFTHHYGYPDLGHQETVVYGEYFFWKKQDFLNLLETKIITSHDKVLSKTHYSYDSYGNILQEQLTANLTGTQNSTISITNPQDESGCDHLVTTYSYDTTPYHNLIRKTTQDGLSYVFEYLPSTHLKTAEFTLNQGHIELRTFYIYNHDHVLIEKIEDDGSAKDKNNLQGVTHRKMIVYHISKDPNSYNFPSMIEEKGWNLQKKTAELLSKTIITYNPKGLVEKKALFDSQSTLISFTSYSYDAKNRLILSEDEKGRRSLYGYDALNNLTYEKKGGQSKSLHIENDMLGNPLTLTTNYQHLKQEKASYSYDQKKRLISHSDSYNNPTQIIYDDFDQPLTTVLPSRFSHKGKNFRPTIYTKNDCFGNVLESTDALGYTIKKTYNFYNQPLCITYPDGSQDKFIYSSSGKLLQEHLRSGCLISYTYDYLGRVLKKQTFSSKGALLSSIESSYKGSLLVKQKDHHNTITSYRYDAFCRKIEEKVTQDSLTLSLKTFSYDLQGNPTSIIEHSSLGEGMSRGHTAIYNSIGKILEENKIEGSSVVFSKKYTYDSCDRVISITYQNQGNESLELFSYDEKNRLLSYTDQNETVTLKSYEDFIANPLTNSFETEVTTTLPSRTKTVERYNSLQELIFSKTYDKDNQLLSAYFYSYDAKGNLTHQTQEDFESNQLIATCSIEKTYDFFGNIVQIKQTYHDESTRHYFYKYDTHNNLTCAALPDGKQIFYSYDEHLHLTSLYSSDGSIFYSFTYDNYGRCIEEIDHIANTKSQKHYNAIGLVAKETFGHGLCIETSYEGFNRPCAIKLPDSSQLSYSYDAYHIKKIERSSLERKNYSHFFDRYDANQCCLQETSFIPGITLSHTYDPQGKKIATSSPFHSHEVEDYFPDRSLKKTVYKQNKQIIQEFAYDALGHLTSETGLKSYNYTFDSFDSLRKKNNQDLEYSFSFQLLEDAKAEYTYCINGNRTTKKQKNKQLKYEYDALNRLTKLCSETIQIYFTYDAQNRRICKKVYSKGLFGSFFLVYEHLFVYYNDLELGCFEKNGKLKQLLVPSNLEEANPQAVAIELGKNIYLPLYDLFGNITELVDSTSCTIFESYRYSAFGEPCYIDSYGYSCQESSVGNPWQYQSKRLDEESGLVFFGMRYYDALTACWLTPDPLIDLDGMNPYHYVHGNPIHFRDLFGCLSTNSEEEVFNKNSTHTFIPNENPYTQAPWVYTPPGYTYQPSINNALLKKSFYTPYGSYNIYQDKGFATSDHYRFFFINGINTSLREAKAMQASCSQSLSYNVDLFYNSTHGTLYDLNKVSRLHERKNVDLVTELKRCLIHEISYGKQVVVFAHSAGGSILNNTYELLPDSYQKKIHMITFGSAKYLPQKHDSYIINYVSSRDSISIMSNLWNFVSSRNHPFAKKALQHKLTVDYLKPSSLSILKEHAFLEKTYQEALRSSCYNLKQKFDLP